MKGLKPVLLSFSLLAFTGAAAYANDTQQKNAASGGSSMKSQKGQNQARNGMSLDQLKDMKVVGKQGEDVGQISDVVLNLANQKVHAVVIESGGFFGIGGNNYAFQPSELKPGKQKDQLVLNVDKSQLENKQGFEKAQWPGMDDEYWSRSAASGGTQKGSGSQASGQGGQINLVRASELKGQQVQDKSGQEIGEVKDVLIGLNDGRIRNLVIDVKDGGQARIPAKSLSRGTGDKLVVAMDAKQIRSQAKQSGGRNAGAGSSMKPGRNAQPNDTSSPLLGSDRNAASGTSAVPGKDEGEKGVSIPDPGKNEAANPDLSSDKQQ